MSPRTARLRNLQLRRAFAWRRTGLLTPATALADELDWQAAYWHRRDYVSAVHPHDRIADVARGDFW